MGVAAYQRGSNLIQRQLTAEQRPAIFQLMDDLNAIPKYADAGTPFDSVHIFYDRKVWVFQCPTTGFAFWYPSLREGLKRWRIQLTGYDEATNVWTAEPLPTITGGASVLRRLW